MDTFLIDEDIRYWDNFDLLNKLKFANLQILQYLFVNFKDTQMGDLILKISRPGVFDIRCLSWNTATIVFVKNATWVEDDINN